jgi:hypothetical protein
MIRNDLLIQIFCCVDDFCKEFEPEWRKIQLEHTLPKKDTRKKRSSSISLSEIMTIVIFFHHSRFRTFKDYYIYHVKNNLRQFFPNLVSYSWFVSLIKSSVFPLFVFLQGCLGNCTGISLIDSTILTVCHTRRISSHKVFRKLAKRGKTSTGWFYGFKLHLVINDQGEILAYMLTSGNIDDRKPVPELTKNLFGKLFGDRGYISSKLFQELFEKGVQLITKLRKGMHNKLMATLDKILLSQRGMIESVNNKLKSCCQIEHHRHRSPQNFLVNLLAGLVAYMADPNKPTMKLSSTERIQLEALAAA